MKPRITLITVGVDMEDVGLAGWFALSPDGRWIGWARPEAPNMPDESPNPVGWAGMKRLV